MDAPWPTTTSKRNQLFTWCCVCAEETEEPMTTKRRTQLNNGWNGRGNTPNNMTHKIPTINHLYSVFPINIIICKLHLDSLIFPQSSCSVLNFSLFCIEFPCCINI